MMTEPEANERMALLLGWERAAIEGAWLAPLTEASTSLTMQLGVPDFSQWDRFPELQEFLKNLCEPRSEDRRERFECAEQYDQIQREIWNRLGAPRSWSGDGWDLTAEYVLNITPAILRDSIWAVVGEEAEVGSG